MKRREVRQGRVHTIMNSIVRIITTLIRASKNSFDDDISGEHCRSFFSSFDRFHAARQGYTHKLIPMKVRNFFFKRLKSIATLTVLLFSSHAYAQELRLNDLEYFETQ